MTDQGAPTSRGQSHQGRSCCPHCLVSDNSIGSTFAVGAHWLTRTVLRLLWVLGPWSRWGVCSFLSPLMPVRLHHHDFIMYALSTLQCVEVAPRFPTINGTSACPLLGICYVFYSHPTPSSQYLIRHFCG